MHIVIAPDKFKGSIDAPAVAEAMARGARQVFPDASFQLRPAADGGDGTLAALLTAKGGVEKQIEVTGPLGDVTRAPLAFLSDGRLGIEMATASGLALIPEEKRDALRASSRGTGELIRAALSSEGSGDIFVGIGGSASTDVGTGAATAIGWRFLDERGKDLPLGGGSLGDLHRIEGDSVDITSGRKIVGLCDVDNPLLGERGAARVFARQKGATEEQVGILEEGLEKLVTRIEADLGVSVESLAGSGAGGGMGAGLVAFFGGSLGVGFDIVSDAIGLDEAIAGADLVITGEGRLDEQSLAGKAPIAIADRSRRAKVPCFAVAGELLLEPRELRRHGVTAAVGLIQRMGEPDIQSDPADAIARAVAQVLARHYQEEARGRGLLRQRPL
ncbi:MAG: glycerate kinase [Actinomycetota bacterium]